jgi:hypothetical protein
MWVSMDIGAMEGRDNLHNRLLVDSLIVESTLRKGEE